MQNGFNPDNVPSGIDGLICPDSNLFKDKYMVRNGYENNDDRTRMSY